MNRIAGFRAPVGYRRVSFKGGKVMRPSQSFRSQATGQHIRLTHDQDVNAEKVAPGLRAEKYTQRRELVSGMPRDGVVLHLYAGNGNLARTVYKGRAKTHFLVDKHVNPRLRAELGGTVIPIEKDMGSFLDTDLATIPDQFSAVDFDPYGSPGPAIQKFFKHHQIRQPTRIAVTDGYAFWLGLHKNHEGQRVTENHYQISHPGDGSLRNQLRLLDGLMSKMAQRYNLIIRRVNARAARRTIYAGYIARPA